MRQQSEGMRQGDAVKLTFDEEQERLAQTARSFVEATTPSDRIRRLRDAKDPVGFSRDVWKQMADLGWTSICLPEEYGGLGLGFAPLCIVLEEAGRGVGLLSRVLDRLCVGHSAEMLGGATQAFDDTLAYLKSRRQFGVTIGSFQALQHRAARLFIELSLARSAVVAAARTVDESPESLPRMASLAKARASDVFVQVA